MTPFQLVSEMNAAFSNPKGVPYAINWEKLTKQCKNIAGDSVELRGEAKELQVALQSKDLGAVRDALCDIMVFALGTFHFIGLDADKDMAEVVRCVMTRFCKNEEHLIATVKHYDELGVNHYIEGEFPRKCLKSSSDQGDGEYPKGKFLKALGYEQPVFKLPNVTDDMRKARESRQAEFDRKKKAIERQVNEYRAKLELDAFGLPAFDASKNNADELIQPVTI